MESAERPVRQTAVKILLAVLGVIAIAACARSSPVPEGAGSGVRGTVLAGPACGGPVIMDSPCPDKPVVAEISVSEVGSQDVVATVRSTSDGKFSIELPPGNYTLKPSATGGAIFPAGKPKDVTVDAGGFADVTLNMDTGIR
jgi:hypothetical protein